MHIVVLGSPNLDSRIDFIINETAIEVPDFHILVVVSLKLDSRIDYIIKYQAP